MKTLVMIATGFWLLAAVAVNVSIAGACQWHDEDAVTTVFDPTDNIHSG